MPTDIVRKVREFAREELVGNEDRFDALAPPPLELYRSFHEADLSNWWLPKEFGGAGLGLEQSVDIVSELAYGDAGVAFSLFVSILGTSMVNLYGSDRTRERYLAPMAENGGFCATLGSEHAAGSELARIETSVRADGSELLVEGEKAFSTNTDFADFLVAVAQEPGSDSRYAAVVVPRNNPGVVIDKRWEMVGVRASATYQVTLDGCRVSSEDRLSGSGLRVLEVGLNASRILVAATAVGLSRRIRDLSMDYAACKNVNGRPLREHDVFAAKLGHMESRIEVMRNQCLAAAREYDLVMASEDPTRRFQRKGALRSALTAKLFCGQEGWSIADTGSQMFGGFGYTRESPIGKLVRDMRHVAVIEGGEDVLRDTLYRRSVLPTAQRI
ncbi:acyl-CoA dehydrogenase family protein [Nocardiopsis oceani]